MKNNRACRPAACKKFQQSQQGKASETTFISPVRKVSKTRLFPSVAVSGPPVDYHWLSVSGVEYKQSNENHNCDRHLELEHIFSIKYF